MPITPTSLKTLIDSQITDKTQPYSIDNQEVGARLKDIVDLFTPLQFPNTAARLSYLTNPNAQPFQKADDLEDGLTYYINKNGTAWVLYSTSAPRTEVVLFSNQSELIVPWTSERKSKFGAAAVFVVETIDEDGKYRQKSQLEIYPDNISDTASYHIDLGGGNQSGRLVIK